MNHSQPCTEMIVESDSIVRSTDLLRGHGTILLVEDESFLREVTCEILESAGYRVETASDGREALTHFDADPRICLMVTDIDMPRRRP